MGKVTSLYGKTTGKIGSIVFSTSGGETIAREYNPHVSNPSTMPQVNQRARLKLMSQLSACLAPSIVMQKSGLVSRRNKFTKKNMDACYASNGVAQITYENVQLTEGSAGLPQISASVGTDEQSGLRTLSAYFASRPASNISRVVYSLYAKTDEGKLTLVASKISSTFGDEGVYFPAQFSEYATINAEVVIYAYGMCDTSEQASARYGNLNVTNGEDIATLVANRSINYEDYQFTQTRGATLGVNGQPIVPTPSGYARVFVTALAGGSVTGGGSFEIGQNATVVATPDSGFDFVRWVYNGTNTTASTSASYTFEVQGQTDLVAVFEMQGHEGL